MTKNKNLIVADFFVSDEEQAEWDYVQNIKSEDLNSFAKKAFMKAVKAKIEKKKDSLILHPKQTDFNDFYKDKNGNLLLSIASKTSKEIDKLEIEV